jgi:hypothetical protein
MNARIIIAVLAILSTHCSAVLAQNHLEPEEGILNSDEEDWNYAEKLHAILMKDAPFYHLARMVCIPSNHPEWVVTLVRDDEAPGEQSAYLVELAVVEKSLWNEKNFRAVKVKKSRARFDRKTAEAVQEVWRLMLRTVRYPDKDRNGLDGESYHFSRAVPLIDRGRPFPLGGFEQGQVWSPDDETLAGELVAIGELMRQYPVARPEARDKLRSEILAKSNGLRAKLDRPRQSK